MGRRIEGIHRITRADQLLDQMGELCRPAGPAMQQQDCRPLAPAQHRQPEAQSDALRTGQQRQLPILRRPLARHHERPTHTLGRPTRRDAADRPVETANPGQAAHLAPPQFTACLAARRTRSDSSPAPMPGQRQTANHQHQVGQGDVGFLGTFRQAGDHDLDMPAQDLAKPSGRRATSARVAGSGQPASTCASRCLRDR